MHQSLEKQLESRRIARAARHAHRLARGGAVLLLLPRYRGRFDFTFGMFHQRRPLRIVYGTATHRMAERLKTAQRVTDEYYRWLANGGADARFTRIARPDGRRAGGIDMETPQFRQWWLR